MEQVSIRLLPHLPPHFVFNTVGGKELKTRSPNPENLPQREKRKKTRITASASDQKLTQAPGSPARVTGTERKLPFPKAERLHPPRTGPQAPSQQLVRSGTSTVCPLACTLNPPGKWRATVLANRLHPEKEQRSQGYIRNWVCSWEKGVHGKRQTQAPALPGNRNEGCLPGGSQVPEKMSPGLGADKRLFSFQS